MSQAFPASISVVDSHTEGEPTRVVMDGWPQPEGATMAERRDHLRLRQDHLRRAVVLEPRGHEAVVGALLTPPVEPGSLAGVIFFDNEGCLGMCGHGTIGVVRTLSELGRLGSGAIRFDTPVGPVRAELDEGGSVTVRNVPAYCQAQDVTVHVPELGQVKGDVAWGGNWFFLTALPGEPLELGNRERLTRLTLRIKDALRAQGVRGADGAEIDHVELFGAASRPDADSRNFVMCPSGAYDRSPCGTGTSAKLAVLHARGQLALGSPWRQEGITGGLFTAWLGEDQGRVVPHIRGRAFITGRTTLFFDPADPFRHGLSDPGRRSA
jgi:4-hydroxyproline epimerase